MKRISLFIVMASILTGCSSDKQTRLKQLEADRAKLDQEIETLRAELQISNPDNVNGINKVVEVKQIVTAEFKHYIKIQGTVESDNNILIPAQASGVVKKIIVNEGQQVKKGQLLAELDGAIYERSIAELETNLELATTMFERQQRLWNKKIGSEVQYLQAKANKESLTQRLASVVEQYRLTKITAPISGSIDQILIKENEATAAGFGTIRVVKLTELKITAKLSEVYQGSVNKGDSVLIDIPGLKTSFISSISSVSQVIDPKSRVFNIEIHVPKKQHELRPNMLVKLSINDYSNPLGLAIPLKSIQKTADQSFVFTAEQTEDSNDALWIVKKCFVEPGKLNQNKLEILSGLKNGDYLVIAGHQDLTDNQLVRLAQKEQPLTKVDQEKE